MNCREGWIDVIENFNLNEIGLASTEAKLSAVDRTIKDLDRNRQDEADLCMMLEGLTALRQWCTAPTRKDLDKTKAFYKFFESVMVGAFYRYRKSKTATWSIKKNWLKALGIALLPVLSAVVTLILEKVDQIAVGKAVPVAFVLVTAFCLIQMYLEWAKNKNDKETWVRHSICYSRLNLALSIFALSKQTEEDYAYLVQRTYAILEQNLDQFALNMSSHGMAKRPDISACEGEDDDDE